MAVNSFLGDSLHVSLVKEVERGTWQAPTFTQGNNIPVDVAPIANTQEATDTGVLATTKMDQPEIVAGITSGTAATPLNIRHSGDATGVLAPEWFSWGQAGGLKITDSVGDGSGLAWLHWDKVHRCDSYSLMQRYYRCGETAAGQQYGLRGAVANLTINMPAVNEAIQASLDWSGAYMSEADIATETPRDYNRGSAFACAGVITSVGTAVTGVDTLFTEEVAVGDTLTANALTAVVDSITDNTNLVLVGAFSSDVTSEVFTTENTDKAVDTTNKIATLNTTAFTIGGVPHYMESGTISLAHNITPNTDSAANGGVGGYNWAERKTGSYTCQLTVKKLPVSTYASNSKLRESTKETIVINLSDNIAFELTSAQLKSQAVEMGEGGLVDNLTFNFDQFYIKQLAIA
ncbi:MAG: hypothetical protein GY799_12255 [Desulfobulbaceae bacterium]|nr:hypothetical protein [Desulfobulbaceae bacterium]